MVLLSTEHLPQTLFMNTYPKQWPDAKQIPLYQTGTVLEKYIGVYF